MEQAVGFANAVGSEDLSWEHYGTISERLLLGMVVLLQKLGALQTVVPPEAMPLGG